MNVNDTKRMSLIQTGNQRKRYFVSAQTGTKGLIYSSVDVKASMDQNKEQALAAGYNVLLQNNVKNNPIDFKIFFGCFYGK